MSRWVVSILLLASLWARAEPVALEKPLYAEVFLKGTTAKATKISGNLTTYDDANFTLKIGKDDRTLAWAEVSPSSAFTLRQRLIDKTKATDWLVLAQFGLDIGAKEQAQGALRQAVKLDPSLKKQADELLAAPAKEETSPATEAPKPAGDAKPKGDGDLIKNADEPGVPAPQPGRKKGEKVERVKYTPATPEQAAEAMKRIRDQQAKVADQIKVQFAEFETDHFIVFTDWDEREHAFLKKNLEEAYKVVSKQFDMSPKENIFVGRLPVYMFAEYSDFRSFAQTIDRFQVTQTVAGYYHGNEAGFGHMSMWKPNESLTGTRNIKDAERLWAYVLVHEFTHAFLARYRSNEFIPRWLNEGIAEVIASSQFPLRDHQRVARSMALNGGDVSMLFDDENMPSGVYYPVMQSMVELLVKTDRKKFIKLIDDIKDGMDPEEALQTGFKTNYAGFARSWREWAKKLN